MKKNTKAVKKTTSKKPVVKQKVKVVAPQFPGFPQAMQAFDEWKTGTSLSDIVSKYKLPKRDTAYKPFLVLAGGLDGFRALRAQGAGGQAAFGGKRGGGTPRTAGEPRVQRDESQVPRNSMSKAKGWTARNVYKPIIVSVEKVGNMAWRKLLYTIYTSPKGNEYVEAKANEKADLIRPAQPKSPKRDMQGAPIPGEFWIDSHAKDLRFKKLENSTLVRKERKEEALVKRGQKAQVAKKKAVNKRKATIERLVKEEKRAAKLTKALKPKSVVKTTKPVAKKSAARKVRK